MPDRGPLTGWRDEADVNHHRQGADHGAEGGPAAVRYQPLPTQPALVRDLSLVLPASVTAAAVNDVLRREGGTLLERLEVLDEYRGPGLPEGTRGVTWRCTFRDPEGTRTLTDREVDALLSRMLTALEVHLDVRRRSA